MIIQLLPFIIFITSMKFIIDIKNNKDLLTIKVFGISNFKVLSISLISFHWLVSLFLLNPIPLRCQNTMKKLKQITQEI